MLLYVYKAVELLGLEHVRGHIRKLETLPAHHKGNKTPNRHK